MEVLPGGGEDGKVVGRWEGQSRSFYFIVLTEEE